MRSERDRADAHQDTELVLGPDGGRWAYSVATGSFSRITETGVAVGQLRASRQLLVWANGRFLAPPRQQGVAEWGADINELGVIAGGRNHSSRDQAAVFWSAEVIDIPPKVNPSSRATCISDTGVVGGFEVGETILADRAFVWHRGTYALVDELLPDAGCTVLRITEANAGAEFAGVMTCGADAGGFETVRLVIEQL